MDKLVEECGVVGVFDNGDAANLVYLGLHALQHRGQEACGIVTMSPPNSVFEHRAFGLVSETINKSVIDSLPGSMGIGHVRYSTHGGPLLQNIQPFVFRTPLLGPTAIAHNGNLTNAGVLREKLENGGSIFTSTSDSEVIIHLLARSKKKLLSDRIAETMGTIKGAYSLILMTNDQLYGIRDPFGFRPLVIGKKNTTWLLASETCALDLLGATHVRDVEPGEVVRFTKDEGLVSFFPRGVQKKRAFCSFEPIYFSRPDSSIMYETVYNRRKRIGEILAQETAVPADVVIAVPDSGVPMAIGYAKESKLPLELGLIRNHYVGRTFIEPTQSIRDFGVKLKLNPVRGILEGQRVVVVDDSLVRGTTSVKIIRMLRSAGAAEIHLRIGSPPITHSCYYGVATPDREGLIAAQKSVDEIGAYLGSDSIAYLSLAGLKRALQDEKGQGYCYACFSGSYPEETFQRIAAQPIDETIVRNMAWQRPDFPHLSH